MVEPVNVLGDGDLDWGKLPAYATRLERDTVRWDLSLLDQGQVVAAMSNAATLGFCRSLVPTSYLLSEARANDGTRPRWGDSRCPVNEVPQAIGGWSCRPVPPRNVYSVLSNPVSVGLQARHDTMVV